MGVARRGQRAKAPLDFENFSKKGSFLRFEWEKTNSRLLDPLENLRKNLPVVPPGKNPSDARRCHNRLSPRLCTKFRKYVSLQLTRRLVSWSRSVSSKYGSIGRNPSKGGEGSKKGRAETIQAWVVYFQRYHCLSVSVCSGGTCLWPHCLMKKTLKLDCFTAKVSAPRHI